MCVISFVLLEFRRVSLPHRNTYSTTLKTVSFPKFKMYEYPDKHCNYEYPRGGTCLLIKHEIRKLIKHISLLMTDFIRITFNNNTKIYNLYIPPSDSVYYDEQYVELLCSTFVEGESDEPIIAIGDLNARLGNLNSINEQYQYDASVDSGTNENGRHLSQILFNTSNAIPLNHLQHGAHRYKGEFTFERNERQKSQIDWCLVNPCCLEIVENFQIHKDCPSLSDHKPISVTLNTKSQKSLSSLVEAACNLNIKQSNHSKVPIIRSQNTNLTCMDNLLKHKIEQTDLNSMNSHEIADFLHQSIHTYGKLAKIKC